MKQSATFFVKAKTSNNRKRGSPDERMCLTSFSRKTPKLVYNNFFSSAWCSTSSMPDKESENISSTAMRGKSPEKRAKTFVFSMWLIHATKQSKEAHENETNHYLLAREFSASMFCDSSRRLFSPFKYQRKDLMQKQNAFFANALCHNAFLANLTPKISIQNVIQLQMRTREFLNILRSIFSLFPHLCAYSIRNLVE